MEAADRLCLINCQQCIKYFQPSRHQYVVAAGGDKKKLGFYTFTLVVRIINHFPFLRNSYSKTYMSGKLADTLIEMDWVSIEPLRSSPSTLYNAQYISTSTCFITFMFVCYKPISLSERE